MKTKKILKYFFVAAIIGVFFAACKKKDVTPADTDTSGASDNVMAEGTFNDVSNISDQAAGGVLTSYLSAYTNGSENRGISSCASVVRDSSYNGGNTIHTTTITFTAGCQCADGKFRSGIITVTWTGHYYTVGNTITIAFTNYTVNGNAVTGTYKIVNNGNYTYTIDVNGTIAKSGGNTITWVSHRVRTMTAGFTTPTDPTDDVYSITGSASGTNANGAFSDNITSALRVHMDCNQCKIESGVWDMTPVGKPTRTIDFGTDGTCDNQVKVSINGFSSMITI